MRACLIAAFSLFVILGQSTAGAQADKADTANLIDWYYGAVYGTGVYRVGDKTVAQFRLPFSYAPKIFQGKGWSGKLLLPVSVGLYDFDLSTVFEERISDRVGTFAFLPGLEFLVPVGDTWLLKPFANLGVGGENTSGGRALIYAVGLKSRGSWFRDRTEFTLGGELQFAGYRTNEDFTSTLSRIGIGVNTVFPMAGRIRGRELNWGMHAVYRHYFKDFESLFPSRASLETVEIADELEVALTIGVYRPFRILGFGLDRLGVGLLFGEDLRGIRLITGFPF